MIACSPRRKEQATRGEILLRSMISKCSEINFFLGSSI